MLRLGDFDIKKSKCMLLGKSPFDSMSIKMGSCVIAFEENLDILGVNYTKEHQFDIHLDNPVNAARRAMLNFSSAGMAYPAWSLYRGENLLMEEYWRTLPIVWSRYYLSNTKSIEASRRFSGYHFKAGPRF